MPENSDPTRRDVMKAAGIVTAAAAVGNLEGAPAILKVHAASDQIRYGMIGDGAANIAAAQSSYSKSVAAKKKVSA